MMFRTYYYFESKIMRHSWINIMFSGIWILHTGAIIVSEMLVSIWRNTLQRRGCCDQLQLPASRGNQMAALALQWISIQEIDSNTINAILNINTLIREIYDFYLLFSSPATFAKKDILCQVLLSWEIWCMVSQDVFSGMHISRNVHRAFFKTHIFT